MFVILKLLKPFIMPPMLIFVGLILGIVLIKRRQRVAKTLLFAALAIYYTLSIQPISFLLSRSLEHKISQPSLANTNDIETIVVLAGGMNKQEGAVPFPELGGVSLKRLWRGIQVYREIGGATPLLYSGGSGDPFDPISEEAELAKQHAISMGISERDFWTESFSRDTYENGVAVKRVLDERFPGYGTHKIILVTSAWHMLRANAVMDKMGILTIPAPADFSSGTFKINPLSFLPSHSHFYSSVTSIHEWIGMIGYKMRNRI